MPKSTKRIKLVFISAIAFIVLLLFISVVQIISINNKRQEIARQQAEIARLENKIDYYESQVNKTDDKNIDDSINTGVQV